MNDEQRWYSVQIDVRVLATSGEDAQRMAAQCVRLPTPETAQSFDLSGFEGKTLAIDSLQIQPAIRA